MSAITQPRTNQEQTLHSGILISLELAQMLISHLAINSETDASARECLAQLKTSQGVNE